jgi:uncharacterized protein YfiM (DUF2279 family)
MNRPYFSLFVVAILTWSALRGAADLPVIADGQVLTALLRAVLLVAGVLALRALWQGRRDAARVTAVWALLALGLVVAQDIAVGYTRAYLADRLLATTLLAFVVGSAAWRARRAPERA